MSKENVYTINANADGGNYSIKVLIGESYGKFTNAFISADRSEVKATLENESYVGRKKEDIYNSLFVSFKLKEDEPVEFMFDTRALGIEGSQYRANKEKCNDKQLVMNTLLSVAVMQLVNMDKSEYQKEMNFDINLSTGLPVKEWFTKGDKETYASLFKGQHVIEFKDRYITQELGIEKINLNVKDVDVQIEGIAALELVSDVESIEQDEIVNYANKEIVIVDIGQHTTDIAGAKYVYDRRDKSLSLETSRKLVDGINIGIGDVLEDIVEEIQKSKIVDRNEELTPEHILEAVMDFNGVLTSCGVDISSIYEKHMIAFANRIAEYFIRMCDEAGSRQRLNLILLSGGGSNEHIIVRAFKEFIAKNEYNSEIVDVMNEYCEPVYANALGYDKMSKFNK